MMYTIEDLCYHQNVLKFLSYTERRGSVLHLCKFYFVYRGKLVRASHFKWPALQLKHALREVSNRQNAQIF